MSDENKNGDGNNTGAHILFILSFQLAIFTTTTNNKQNKKQKNNVDRPKKRQQTTNTSTSSSPQSRSSLFRVGSGNAHNEALFSLLKDETIAYCLSHGLVMQIDAQTATHAPVTLLPTPVSHLFAATTKQYKNSINQSINQSIQSINQSINQSNQSNQSINQPTNPINPFNNKQQIPKDAYDSVHSLSKDLNILLDAVARHPTFLSETLAL